MPSDAAPPVARAAPLAAVTIAAPAATGAASRRRSGGLDLARAAAIAAVLVSHLLSVRPLGPRAAAATVYLGAAGVELFFSLSGFLIGRLLIDLAEGGLRPARIGRFLGRRWLRTLPLYYAVLGFSIWLFARPDWPSLFFMQNFYPEASRVVPVSWSLVMEEYFYALFPAFLVVGGWLAGGRLRGVALVRSVALAVIAVATAWRFAAAFGAVVPAESWFHTAPLGRLDCAAYGVLAACVARRPGLARVPAGWAIALGLLGAASVAVLFLVAAEPALRAGSGFAAWGWLYRPLQWSLLDACFAVLVWGLWRRLPRLPAGLAGPALALSTLSYSLYLTHLFPIAFLLPGLVARFGGSLGGLFCGAAMLPLAACTWALIERPFLALRDRVLSA
ncbi:MAG TPA: acyltransferase [Acetobacteraceae bacterium]|nr:acyltransferase [Acetobacteraceae bacterium]